MPRWISPKEAVAEFNKGGLVILPTETVWGIACSATNKTAINLMTKIKGRDSLKPFALAFPDLSSAQESGLALWPSGALLLAAAFWPGPLTLVLASKTEDLPPGLLSPSKTLGFRVPKHPESMSILESCFPLALTSANESGQEPPKGPFPDLLFPEIPRVQTESHPGSISSTVVQMDEKDFRILRQGVVSPEALEEVLEGVIEEDEKNDPR